MVAYQVQYKVRRTIIHLLLYENKTQTICEKNIEVHTELFKTRFTAIAKTSNHSRNPSKGLVTDQEY